MRAKTSTWFECVVKYERTNEEGNKQKVSENYVVETMSFTEAEAKIIKEITPYATGDLEIKKIAPLSISEIFFSDKDKDDKWYKCKLAFITIDEKSSKEKRTTVSYIVQADSLKTAMEYVTKEMEQGMVDYLTSAINETKYMDVFCS